MKVLADAWAARWRRNDFHLVRTVPDSRELLGRKVPPSSSRGTAWRMGGRVLHHRRKHLPDERATAWRPATRRPARAAGSSSGREDAAHVRRGRAGSLPRRVVDGFSAHADRNDLLRWLRGFARPPKMLHVVHGEPDAAPSLADLARAELHWT